MSDNTWSARSAIIFGFFGLIVLFGGFVAWGTTTQIAGRSSHRGALRSTKNRRLSSIQPAGSSSEILIDEGDRVAAGDVLMKLDDQQLQSQLTIVEGQLYELMARRGRLEAERDERNDVRFEEELLEAGRRDPELQELIDGQANLFHARNETRARAVEQLTQQRLQIINQITGIVAQEDSLAEQLDLIQQELDSQQKLAGPRLGTGLFRAGFAPSGGVAWRAIG